MNERQMLNWKGTSKIDDIEIEGQHGHRDSFGLDSDEWFRKRCTILYEHKLKLGENDI